MKLLELLKVMDEYNVVTIMNNACKPIIEYTIIGEIPNYILKEIVDQDVKSTSTDYSLKYETAYTDIFLA